MDRKIYLARHGKIDYGKEKRFIGVTDLPLSKIGIEQAEMINSFFSDIVIDKVFISPLKRCRETAEIILSDRKVEKIIVSQFTEINLGEWDNKPIKYIKENFPNLFEERGLHIDEFIPPGGESFENLSQRVIPAFESIIKNVSGNILIVAHAGVNRVILGKLLGIPLNEIFDIEQPYGCVNELMWCEQGNEWQYKRVV